MNLMSILGMDCTLALILLPIAFVFNAYGSPFGKVLDISILQSSNLYFMKSFDFDLWNKTYLSVPCMVLLISSIIVIQHPSLNGNAVGYIPYPPNENPERIETSHNINAFFSNVCTKAGRSQYPSLCHRIHESKERGYGFPLWIAKKRDGKEEQEVTQPRTIRDKQFNPWAGKRKRGDNYNPWAGKRSDAQFNPWAGKKRDDKM